MVEKEKGRFHFREPILLASGPVAETTLLDIHFRRKYFFGGHGRFVNGMTT